MFVTVSVKNLEKRFRRIPVLHDVSLNVEGGELLALLGPSGSGKTTLLRAIAGLEEIDAGEVFFDDINSNQLTLRERRIGFVFQQYALFKHMTVMENIAFGLRARPRASRPAKAAIRARVLELLSLVQLDGLEARFPPSSPAASASAWPLPAPLPLNLVCCCSMNLSARLMPRCARTCAAGCVNCMTAPATPPCSSPTTRKRLLNWLIVWPS